MSRRTLLGSIVYAADAVRAFSVTSEETSSNAYSAFIKNLDLFPEAPADGETLFVEMVCTETDYSAYASLYESPVQYYLGFYNINNSLDPNSKFAVLQYGTSKHTQINNLFTLKDNKVYPIGGWNGGFIKGLTYNVRYWYVPFVVGETDLRGGN